MAISLGSSPIRGAVLGQITSYLTRGERGGSCTQPDKCVTYSQEGAVHGQITEQLNHKGELCMAS